MGQDNNELKKFDMGVSKLRSDEVKKLYAGLLTYTKSLKTQKEQMKEELLQSKIKNLDTDFVNKTDPAECRIRAFIGMVDTIKNDFGAMFEEKGKLLEVIENDYNEISECLKIKKDMLKNLTDIEAELLNFEVFKTGIEKTIKEEKENKDKEIETYKEKLKKEKETLDRELEEKEYEIQKNISRLEQKYKEKENELKAIENENKDLKRELEGIKKEVDNFDNILKEKIDEAVSKNTDTLNKDYEHKTQILKTNFDSTIKSLNMQIATKSSEIATLNNAVESFDNKLKEAYKQINKMADAALEANSDKKYAAALEKTINTEKEQKK